MASENKQPMENKLEGSINTGLVCKLHIWMPIDQDKMFDCLSGGVRPKDPAKDKFDFSVPVSAEASNTAISSCTASCGCLPCRFLSVFQGCWQCHKAAKTQVRGEAVRNLHDGWHTMEAEDIAVFLTKPRLRVCDRCRVARYCSKDCQRQEWKNHKQVCGSLQLFGKNISPGTLLCTYDPAVFVHR